MKTMRLRTRLALGFGSVAAVAMLLGGAGLYSAHRNQRAVMDLGEHRLPAVQALLSIKEAGTAIKSVQRTLLNLDLDPKVYVRQFNLFGQAQTNYEQGLKVYGAVPRTAEEERLWTEFQAAWEVYRKDNDEFLKLAKEMAALKIGNPVVLERDLSRFRADHLQWVVRLLDACNTQVVPEGGEDPKACAYGKWRSGAIPENAELMQEIQATDPEHAAFHAAISRIKEQIKAGQIDAARKAAGENLAATSKTIQDRLSRMVQVAAKGGALSVRLNQQAMEVARAAQLKAADLLDLLVAAGLKLGDQQAHESIASARFFQKLAVALMALGVLGAVIIAVTLTRLITGSIQRVTADLMAGAEQTVAAAAQVAAASEGLAEGASEQAASLEETSASLEEMASMTRRNAENAGKANALTRQAREAAEAGSADMAAMAVAMNEIKAGSDDIAKILRTIDEIAFQTNILALNAAVEAARAGAAGMGFAVVADEVRNLAQRSAESAKETAQKIESAISRTAQGAALSQKVATTLDGIVEKVREVDTLVAEVAAASGEQSQGVSQINTAVTQMDKVTQHNAATAEESAAASEELNAQAEAVLSGVGDLQRLVDGESATRKAAAIRSQRLAERSQRKALATTRSAATDGIKARKTAVVAAPGNAPVADPRATAPVASGWVD